MHDIPDILVYDLANPDNAPSQSIQARYWKTVDLADSSEHDKYKVGTSLYRGSTLLGRGVNQEKSHPAQKEYNKAREFSRNQVGPQHAVQVVKGVDEISAKLITEVYQNRTREQFQLMGSVYDILRQSGKLTGTTVNAGNIIQRLVKQGILNRQKTVHQDGRIQLDLSVSDGIERRLVEVIEKVQMHDNLHSEVSAILNAKRADLTGSDAYVARVGKRNGVKPRNVLNARPCPACINALLEQGVGRVVYAVQPKGDASATLLVVEGLTDKTKDTSPELIRDIVKMYYRQ